MLSNSVADALVQRGQVALRELERGRQGAIVQPAADLTAQDTLQLSAEAKEASRANRAALMDSPQRQMINHLYRGFHLIKDGQYREATEHFQNAKALKEMGVVGTADHEIKMALPANASQAKQLVQTLAGKHMAYNSGSLRINFAKLSFPDFQATEAANRHRRFPSLQGKDDSEKAIREYLRHEEALMAAEENIHTYQNMRGGAHVSYVEKPGDKDPGELDIAATFEQQGVPVTNDFIKRYAGRDRQIRNTEIWDLIDGPQGEVHRVRIPRPNGDNQI